MSGEKKDPALTSATFALKDVLQGDLLNTLPRIVDAQAIDGIMRDARHRFNAGAIWIVSCAQAELVTPDGHSALRHAMTEFRRGGGARFVASAARPAIEEAIRTAAKGYVSIELSFAKTFDEAMALGRTYRALRDKKF